MAGGGGSYASVGGGWIVAEVKRRAVGQACYVMLGGEWWQRGTAVLVSCGWKV